MVRHYAKTFRNAAVSVAWQEIRSWGRYKLAFATEAWLNEFVTPADDSKSSAITVMTHREIAADVETDARHVGRDRPRRLQRFSFRLGEAT